MIRFFNKQKQFEQDMMAQGKQYSSGFYGDSLRRLKKNKMAGLHRDVYCIVGITVPVFILASLFQYVFAVKLQVLPTQDGGSHPTSLCLRWL